jgi:putative transposase
MPVRLYAHLTWTTLRRLPLLNPEAASFLHRFFRIEAKRHGVGVVETGILTNHVHTIVKLPPVIDIPRLVQGLKGASARIANRDGLMPRARLRWADGYDLRSVGIRQLPSAVRYVRTQADRHPGLAIVLQDATRRASPSGDVTNEDRDDVEE